MKVQEQDVFHGIALTQLVEHQYFKALNKASKRYGHYLLNHDRRFFVKYRTNSGSAWQFVFSRPELDAIEEDRRQRGFTFVVLVCGESTVCALSVEDLDVLLSWKAPGSQSIRVDAPVGGSMTVTGSGGKLRNKVPHNSYPAKLLNPT